MRALGAVVADADRICHTALDRADIAAKIIENFGDVRDETGRIDRRKLRAVFDDAGSRQALESSNTLPDEDGKVGELRKEIKLNLAKGQWWWN